MGGKKAGPQRIQPLSIVTLAIWRFRHTRFLLLVTTLGLIAAVMVACAVPLFTRTTITAGLRNLLTSSLYTGGQPAGQLQYTFSSWAFTSSYVDEVLRDDIRGGLQQNQLDQFLSSSIETIHYTYGLQLTTKLKPKPAQVTVTSGDFATIAPSHIQLRQGRMPNPHSKELEIIITPDTADIFHLHLNQTLNLTLPYALQPGITEKQKAQLGELQVTAHIVGIFSVPDQDRPFWDGNDFTVIDLGNGQSGAFFLTDNMLLRQIYDQANEKGTQGKAGGEPGIYQIADSAYSFPATIWRLSIDPRKVNADQLDTLAERFKAYQSYLSNKYGNMTLNNTTMRILNRPTIKYGGSLFIYSELLRSNETTGILDQYRERISVTTLPVNIIAIQIIALVLFFVSLSVSLLIDRQTEAIAVLRSRGASGDQIFGSLFLQGIFLCLVALLLGLPLALLAAFFLAQQALPETDKNALDVLTVAPFQTFVQALPYALIILLICLVTLFFSLRRSASMDVLAVRHEASRPRRQSLFMRLHLDIVAALIALLGYGIAIYAGSTSAQLDARAQTLLLTPLTLLAPILLILAGVFLFLRFYPKLVALLAGIASRWNSFSPVLALAQMARNPGQSIRMILLLSLATSFAIFTLVFSATQERHAAETASYIAGADIRVNLPFTYSPESAAQLLQRLRQLPGVRSVSTGFNSDGSINGTTGDIPLSLLQLRAVDATTFAQTAYWPDHAQLEQMMNRLVSLREQAKQQDVVPVYVDELLWQQLHLKEGATFEAQINNLDYGTLKCLVLGKVAHIPTITDSTAGQLSDSPPPPGGILLDYQTYLNYYQKLSSDSNLNRPLNINQLWFRTTDDENVLKTLRSELEKYSHDSFDRRAIKQSLDVDPLNLNMLGILTLGAITALLLATVGDLIASVLGIRPRLTNFAVLRALGTAPRQLASIIGWEQGFIYILAICIGLLCGSLLTFTIVPNLIHMSFPRVGTLSSLSPGDFYALQQIVPGTPVLSPLLLIALGLLVLTFAVALWLMLRTVAKPSMSQVLRLNQD